MRFSGRDAILFNLRLLVIRSRFTDLSATRARVSFRSVKSTFLGARLWVLDLANDIHLQGLYRSPGLADNHRVDSTHVTPHLGNLRV